MCFLSSFCSLCLLHVFFFTWCFSLACSTCFSVKYTWCMKPAAGLCKFRLLIRSGHVVRVSAGPHISVRSAVWRWAICSVRHNHQHMRIRSDPDDVEMNLLLLTERRIYWFSSWNTSFILPFNLAVMMSAQRWVSKHQHCVKTETSCR